MLKNEQIASHLSGVENKAELESLSANIVPTVWSSALNEASAPSLQPGMIITVEPGLYVQCSHAQGSSS